MLILQYISTAIFIFFAIYLFYDYHKALLFIAPFSILFQPYLCLRFEAPAISLSFLINFLVFTLFVVKRKEKFKLFPYKTAIVAIFFTNLVGIVVSPLGLSSTIPYVLSLVLSYLLSVCFYFELKTSADLDVAYKSLLFVSLLLAGYSVFEIISQSNPIVKWIADLLPTEKGWIYYQDEIRFGIKRSQSLMCICISWGGLCCLLLSLLIYVRGLALYKINGMLFYFTIAILSLFVFVSGARSAFLYMVVLFLGLFFSNWKKNKTVIIFFILLFALVCGSFVLDMFSSLSSDSDVTGSSISQRQMQLLAALQVISSSPICGLGIKGLSVAQNSNFDVLGAESVWFQQLISFGFLGIIAQIVVYYSIGKYLIKHTFTKKYLPVLIVFGWIVFSTMTSSPGLGEPYFLLVIVIITRLIEIRNSNFICRR